MQPPGTGKNLFKIRIPVFGRGPQNGMPRDKNHILIPENPVPVATEPLTQQALCPAPGHRIANLPTGNHPQTPVRILPAPRPQHRIPAHLLAALPERLLK